MQVNQSRSMPTSSTRTSSDASETGADNTSTIETKQQEAAKMFEVDAAKKKGASPASLTSDLLGTVQTVFDVWAKSAVAGLPGVAGGSLFKALTNTLFQRFGGQSGAQKSLDELAKV